MKYILILAVGLLASCTSQPKATQVGVDTTKVDTTVVDSTVIDTLKTDTIK